VTGRSFSQRVVRIGLILTALRLSVFTLLVVVDRHVHPGIDFLPVLLFLAIVLFPDCLLLEVWVKSPARLTALVIVTSFMFAAGWVLFTDIRKEG
jgi:hypothetical protein